LQQRNGNATPLIVGNGKTSGEAGAKAKLAYCSTSRSRKRRTALPRAYAVSANAGGARPR
jgi:hypothetical protein